MANDYDYFNMGIPKISNEMKLELTYSTVVIPHNSKEAYAVSNKKEAYDPKPNNWNDEYKKVGNEFKRVDSKGCLDREEYECCSNHLSVLSVLIDNCYAECKKWYVNLERSIQNGEWTFKSVIESQALHDFESILWRNSVTVSDILYKIVKNKEWERSRAGMPSKTYLPLKNKCEQTISRFDGLSNLVNRYYNTSIQMHNMEANKKLNRLSMFMLIMTYLMLIFGFFGMNFFTDTNIGIYFVAWGIPFLIGGFLIYYFYLRFVHN